MAEDEMWFGTETFVYRDGYMEHQLKKTQRNITNQNNYFTNMDRRLQQESALVVIPMHKVITKGIRTFSFAKHSF